MVDVVRVKHDGLRSRWRARARVSAAGSVEAKAMTRRGARRRALELAGGKEYVPRPAHRVPPGMRPRWPLVGDTIVEDITGRRLTWDGARWVG